MMESAPRRLGAAIGGVLLLVSTGTTLRAQGDVPPRSPYALPVPGYQGDDDEDEPIRPWRHWGDNHNQGEFVKSLLAPDPVVAVPSPEGARRLRYCRRHPGRCEE